MRILWFTNSLMPPVVSKLGLADVCEPWTWALASLLRDSADVRLAIATARAGAAAAGFDEDGIRYYVLHQPQRRHPFLSTRTDLRRAAEAIEDFQPDLIHVNGTERFYGLVGSLCPDIPVIVSIQGLVSVYRPYRLRGLKWRERLLMLKPRDLLRLRGPMADSVCWLQASRRELKIIHGNCWFIGRTEWDRAWVKAVNPAAQYYWCEEVIRTEFFDATWDLHSLKRHSVVATSALDPRKGIYTLLDAVTILRSWGYELELNLAGDWYPRSALGRPVCHRIGKLGISDLVRFHGRLNASELAALLSRSRVYVSASWVDNSPNSIAEAMLVGTPCVVSFVGGIPSLVEHRRTGLMFPAGDAALLALRIRELFDDDDLACSLSVAARQVSRRRHDPCAVVERLLLIYRDVLHGVSRTQEVAELVGN